MPENRDSDWDWDEFYHHNNDELVGKWGNLVNRVLTFTHKNWDGCVPQPGELRPVDQALLATVSAGFTSIGEQIEAVHLRTALEQAMLLAGEGNKYWDSQAPWSEIKKDKEQAAKTVYTALCVIDSLKILFAPFLPFTSQKLHGLLGYPTSLFGTQNVQTISDSLGEHTGLRYDSAGAVGRWEPSQLPAGRALPLPQPLFIKMDEKIVEEERARIGKTA
jgi:methionyl-tRNA synthetase